MGQTDRSGFAGQPYAQQNVTPGVVVDDRRWQRCPVCFGKGIVPGGFYRTAGLQAPAVDTAPESCRSCNGKGIVK